MNYTNVTSPSYADERNRTVNCFVKFDDFGVPLPFTASPEDVTPHAQKLLEELKAGKYGPIAPFAGDNGNP